MTAAPLTYPTSAGAEPPLFLPPAGDFCQQRQKSPKTPLETAFQDFLTRVGCDFALTCPTRNRFPGFSRFKGLCLHSFPRCAVARRCPLPRWVPWCSTARVPVDIPSRRTTLSARTHTPCRAGPACPAAGMRFLTAGRCGHRPLRRGRRACRITNAGADDRPNSAKRCHSEPVTVSLAWESVLSMRRDTWVPPYGRVRQAALSRPFDIFPLNNLTLARLCAYNISVVFPNRDREGEPP